MLISLSAASKTSDVVSRTYISPLEIYFFVKCNNAYCSNVMAQEFLFTVCQRLQCKLPPSISLAFILVLVRWFCSVSVGWALTEPGKVPHSRCSPSSWRPQQAVSAFYSPAQEWVIVRKATRWTHISRWDKRSKSMQRSWEFHPRTFHV